jgi:Cys-rich repeat protein
LVEGDGVEAYCRGSGGFAECTSNADCPTGQFCGGSTTIGGACTPGC